MAAVVAAPAVLLRAGEGGKGRAHVPITSGNASFNQALAPGTSLGNSLGKMMTTNVVVANVVTTFLNPVEAVEELGAAAAEEGATLTQQGLEHIVERHWFTSGAKNAGKFAEGTMGRDLKSMIQEATSTGTSRANTFNRPGTIFEKDFGTAIGTDIGGNPATKLRVVVRPDGTVVTAFPF